MTEKLLQYIWAFQYYNTTDLQTTEGETVQIIHPGRWNHHQGPDFLDARIKIGATLLVGAVELHLKTSEWFGHGHGNDANYKNVVLHVVLEHDQPFTAAVPVVALQGRISHLLLQKYSQLMQEAPFIPCAGSISSVNPLTLQSWKERLVAERLMRKSETILKSLAASTNHWEEVFWQQLARSYGAKVNSDAFEQMAQAIPVKILAKHKANIQQLEALLLGQAGLLEGPFKDDYMKVLQREYQFLKGKYFLKPFYTPVHFLRMRPHNFPTVRLAQLAALVHGSEHLFSKLLETEDLKKVQQWLSVTASDYWHTHYRPDQPSTYAPKKLGSSTINTIIINTLVPMLFAYGMYHRNEAVKDKAVCWLQETGKEINTITTGFEGLLLEHTSAFDSQALLELKNEYCNNRRCLECSVGNALLKKGI